MISFSNFIEKYHLDQYDDVLELKGREKIDFFNDLSIMIKTICRLFDKITTIFSLRGGQVLMSLAKLQSSKEVITKTDVMNCLNIDRREKLIHAFDYLSEQNYIEIKKRTSKFHMVKLNVKENPDFVLFRDIVQKYWNSPEEEKNKSKKWSDLK
ncbi:MAG: hypothetical protein ACFE9S_11955 [Candidatus Hermodarchaeota archaeon]